MLLPVILFGSRTCLNICIVAQAHVFLLGTHGQFRKYIMDDGFNIKDHSIYCYKIATHCIKKTKLGQYTIYFNILGVADNNTVCFHYMNKSDLKENLF